MLGALYVGSLAGTSSRLVWNWEWNLKKVVEHLSPQEDKARLTVSEGCMRPGLSMREDEGVNTTYMFGSRFSLLLIAGRAVASMPMD